MDNIQDLKRKHYNVKEVLKERVKNGKDVKDKVQEYLQICDELRSLGVEVNDSSPRVLEALKLAGVIDSPHKSSTPPVVESAPITTPPQQESFLYKITLAWTERPGHTPDNTIQIIENYLKENGATLTDSTSADFDGYNEIMKTYEWSGGDKEFAILRRSANYILDIFAENQYEKYNISIFGCKKIQ